MNKRKQIIAKLYAFFLRIITAIAGIDAAKTFDARFRFHKKMNLKNPTRLTEKITYIELHEQSPLAPTCSDKYAVRAYVESKGLGHILVPLAGGPWTRVEDVNFDLLPDCFALKATHGYKMNYLVPDKSKMDVERCRKEMKRWLATTHGTFSIEPHYLHIPHRIYAEKFLESADKLVDYKFYCLNGKPTYIVAIHDRKVDPNKPMAMVEDTFDTEWKLLDATYTRGGNAVGNGEIKKPEKFDEMLDIARRLSEDFKFVRVDLYEVDHKVYFGELTFTPGAGIQPHYKPEFDLEMGKKLKL